ncbi:MAG: amidohydrolase family protein [Limisphaerales bacterium]
MRPAFLRFATIGWLLATGAHFASAVELPPPGHRPTSPGVHALVGGRVVINPSNWWENATVIIRDGLIEAAGRKLPVPADARVWPASNTVIYAGFIDPYLSITGTNAPVSTTHIDPIDGLTSGINFLGVESQEKARLQPGGGYEVASVTPHAHVAAGYTPNAKTLEGLRELGFTAGNVVPAKGILRGTSAFVNLSDAPPNEAVLRADTHQHIAFESQEVYPKSLMGTIAVVRQTFADARHYILDQADYRAKPTARKRPDLNPALDALAPVINKQTTIVFEPGSVLMCDRAAQLAREVGLNFVVVASGHEWRRPDLMKAVNSPFIVPLNLPSAPKLPDQDDWLDVSLDQLRHWDWAAENAALLRAQGLEVALTTHALADRKVFRKNLRLALDRGLSERDALAALTTVPAKLCGVTDRLGTIEKGKIANLTVVEGAGYFDPEAKVRQVWIDGVVFETQPLKSPDGAGAGNLSSKNAPTPPEKKPGTANVASNTGKGDTKKADADKKKSDLAAVQKLRVAQPPNASRGPLLTPKSVFIRNASVWTCGPQGTLTNASVLISGGKVRQVGHFKAELSHDTLVIDASGKHVTPGLIDCHSHTAILGDVNEASLPSTAMVRIADVVNSETENLFQQLAGGLTVANLLHGSANPIGGQNSVIKLRFGAGPDGLKFTNAPAGIKFALGENVKQSNWGDKNTTRFPQSRMGVPTFYANRFTAARQYLDAWAEYRRKGGVPPRTNLELEAIGEILNGTRLIHCHSYRGDEIIAFLRVCEQFDVRVATLQHVLEGYKVADEIARHGAGGSCFTDWWAYKFEVWDAIPYAGSLMRDRGVNVSFNSDSSELARRLYLEAAKAVKYGGTPEVEALKFVTLNPAKQLGVDKWVGSLEPGKDADFAIWSHSPLAHNTVCEQTWIEGVKYFDREAAAERAVSLAKERTDLIAKAKKIASLSGGGVEGGAAAQAAFFENALEKLHELGIAECLDCKQNRKTE